MKSCFVIMPFGGDDQPRRRHFLGVYQGIILPAAERAGYEVKRSDLGGGPGNITSDIIRDLAEADIVIADLTDGNANVLFELGIRHVFRKSGTIHVIDKARPIPFDVGQYRAVKYTTDLPDIPAVVVEIVSAIRLREKHLGRSDNPVHDTVQDLPLDYRAFSSEASLRRVGELERNVEELRAERDELDRKLSALDPSGSVRAQPSDFDIDQLLTQADEIMRSTGDYVLLRLKEAMEERGGRDAFVSELRTVLKSPYLTVNDFSAISNMCIQLNLLEHRRATLEVAHRKYPKEEQLFLGLTGTYISSPAPAMQEQGRRMLEEHLHIERAEDGTPRIPEGVKAPSTQGYGTLFDCYFSLGQPEWALALCDSAISHGARDVVILRNRARALDELDQDKELVEDAYTTIIRSYPEDASAHLWFSDWLHRQDRLIEAYEQDELAVLVDPEYDSTYMHLAIQILNSNFTRTAGGKIQKVTKDAATRAAIPLFVAAIKAGTMSTREKVVNILVRRDALQEARVIAEGKMPEGKYDNSVLDYLRKKAIERSESALESQDDQPRANGVREQATHAGPPQIP